MRIGVLLVWKVMNNSNRMSEPGTPALQPNYLKIFVQRDYSDGTSVKFQTRFPSELEGRVCTNLLFSTVLYVIHNLSLTD